MFKLGNGYGINPCCYPWIPSLENGIPKLKDGSNTSGLRRVIELKDMEINDWDVHKVLAHFDAESANVILIVKWPESISEDIWKGNDLGRFLVKDSYLQLANTTNNDREWGCLWKLKIHERLKIFLWMMKAEVIPTN